MKKLSKKAMKIVDELIILKNRDTVLSNLGYDNECVKAECFVQENIIVDEINKLKRKFVKEVLK